MSRNGVISYLLILCIGIGLPGCTRKLTRPLRMRPLTSYLDYQSTYENITLRVKQLSPRDCEHFLGAAAHRLFKRRHMHPPIYPLQLSITNNSAEQILLKPEDISLRLVDTRRVIKRLQTSSVAQVFGSVAAGLLVTALLTAGSVFALSASGVLMLVAGSMQAIAPFAILGGSAFIVAPVFLLVGTPIASTMKGVEATRQNRILQHEIRTNALKTAITIDAYQTVDTLIFVEKKHYTETFTVTFSNPHDPSEKKVTFLVHLRDRDW